MKKSVLIIFILVSTLALAQSLKAQKIKYLTIDQKVCANKKGMQLVLKEVINDSRCPEGVSCIWAGEVTAIVSVYKDSNVVEETTMVLSLKSAEDNKKWFASYLSSKQKNIKSIAVVPYPKKGVRINSKDYYIKIAYAK
jgi:hypothetical protein